MHLPPSIARHSRLLRQRIKSLMPTHLFGRALLILLVPMVVLQLLVAHIFYTRHWESILRSMASTTAADVAVLLREYQLMRQEEGPDLARLRMWRMGKAMNIDADFIARSARSVVRGQGKEDFPEFYASLDLRIPENFSITTQTKERNVIVRIAVEGRVLQMAFNRKRLVSSTTSIFMVWMLGSSFLLVSIAALFLRNQIRPVVQLAGVAEQFGLGQDVENFTPRGASEVRRAGRAFVTMADRIRRQVASRTEMLAGISHDLRTPLTRMKLELEMSGIPSATRIAMNSDIDQMNHMIDGYLAFARGDAGEAVEPVTIADLLRAVVEPYQRQGADIVLQDCPDITLMLRPHALRRALNNLIDNALRYGGGHATLSAEQTTGLVRIKIRDAGRGIPESEMERVFKPFTRLDASRNLTTGGVGLGLSIAQDIVQHHGGGIALENLRDAEGAIMGLEVTLRLPREIRGA